MQLRSLVRLAAPAIAGLTLVACGTSSTSNPPVASNQSAVTPPAASPSASPSPTKAAIAQLTATGIDKYQVGAKLSTLKAASLVIGEKSTSGCPDWVAAQGVGDYAGIGLVFYKGAILWVNTEKGTYSTAAGIKVGSAYAAVTSAYSSALTLNDGVGGKAISAHSGDSALFFRFDKANAKVTMIEAGKAETLDFRFQEGEGC